MALAVAFVLEGVSFLRAVRPLRREAAEAGRSSLLHLRTEAEPAPADLLREAVDGRTGEDPPPGWRPVGARA